MKLTKEEQWIEDHAEEFVPLSPEKEKEIADALARLRKNAVLNIRINSQDLDQLKEKAKKLGVKYQTFIAEVLHRVAVGQKT
jgi:predicted DNA binding CopG/RHH family protein